MKKAALFILMMIYMTVSSGIAMDIHFCMGKQAGADLFSSKNEKCGVCGMKEKKGCCSDEHRFYKIEDAHKSSSNSFDASIVDWVLPQHALTNLNIVAPIGLQNKAAFLQPADTGPPLFIRYRVFRI